MNYKSIDPVTNELGTKTYTYTIKDELSTISLDAPSYSQINFKEYNYDKNIVRYIYSSN